ncbi:hypothetical protein BDZ89DRAFT_1131409 [Hymenopellis radicata]|nr:hypothetical protein BDZ89DRAFT_1131409 [Hymenopellis radicata]
MTILYPELLLLIFDNASVQTMTSLSLCSHQIRILVFPLLYRHVVFKNNKELSQFSSRVISEANGENLIDELRVADHVRHLEFGGDSDVCYEEDELELLALALEHIKALRGFTWSTALPEDPTIFSAVQTTCKGIQNISLHLGEDFAGDDDEYMATLFGFKGLERLEISTRWMSVDNEILPSSMVDMIRASPNLRILDLSLDSYGDPHPKWDIDTLFQSIAIAPTTLRLREAADLDLQAFSDSTKPTPFRSFLLSHHDKIVSLALPAPQEDFAHGPPSLNLPPDTLPLLREFEGSIYWCSQLSKLQVASKLESLTLLWEPSVSGDYKRGMLLEALQAFSSLKALNMFDGNIFLSAEELKAIVENAPHLECLTCAIDRDETAGTIGSQLSCLNLRALAANIFRYASTIPGVLSEEFVRTLAKHCPALVTVEDLDQRDYDVEAGLVDLTSANRREQVPGLPDWSQAGFERGTQDLPDDSKVGYTLIADQLASQFGLIANDGQDDTAALQTAINAMAQQTVADGMYRLIQLPAGTINLSYMVYYVDTSHLIIRGAGANPDAGGTKLVFRPDEDTKYDTIVNERVRALSSFLAFSITLTQWDLDNMKYSWDFVDDNGNGVSGQATGGWLWPGRSVFRVGSSEVAFKYTRQHSEAPRNRKELFKGSVNYHWRSDEHKTKGWAVSQDNDKAGVKGTSSVRVRYLVVCLQFQHAEHVNRSFHVLLFHPEALELEMKSSIYWHALHEPFTRG